MVYLSNSGDCLGRSTSIEYQRKMFLPRAVRYSQDNRIRRKALLFIGAMGVFTFCNETKWTRGRYQLNSPSKMFISDIFNRLDRNFPQQNCIKWLVSIKKLLCCVDAGNWNIYNSWLSTVGNEQFEKMAITLW